MEENSSTIVNYKKYIDDNILAKPAWLNEVTSTCISLFFFYDRTNHQTLLTRLCRLNKLLCNSSHNISAFTLFLIGPISHHR